ncbi:hypothetical protein Poli38472_007878 [Pythium oligandrum]|uniref:Uncharacterized protein n=1 Tax=Pythium oligandrum TaxID=41045 RepID=A0A8K1FMG0_PYTOL|nr:hypothetical protein Poli38472_007878 [Pythium oligandrum]|eukprot:TMW68206.1 hypothetical protein Poli38472_007878 [Pythium oligandrum]
MLEETPVVPIARMPSMSTDDDTPTVRGEVRRSKDFSTMTPGVDLLALLASESMDADEESDEPLSPLAEKSSQHTPRQETGVVESTLASETTRDEAKSPVEKGAENVSQESDLVECTHVTPRPPPAEPVGEEASTPTSVETRPVQTPPPATPTLTHPSKASSELSAETRQLVYEFLYTKVLRADIAGCMNTPMTSQLDVQLCQVAENQCGSHAREIHDFLYAHLTDAQRLHHLPHLLNDLTRAFHAEAQARHEDVSLETQSSICLIENMFLALGRKSPLQDMYTAEEEEMLEELAH